MDKIQYHEIRYEDYIGYKIRTEPNFSVFTNFLFNGSRRGIIDEDINELELLFKEINTFVAYLKENLHGILDDMGLSVNDRYNKIRYLYRIDMYKEVSNFEYGDFYLSTNFLTAITFSTLSAGELCEISYLCACDIKNLNITFKDEKINIIMESIIKKHDKYEKTEKVILAVRNVNYNDLKTESGYKYTDFHIKRMYDSEVSLSSEETNNVRLTNLPLYDFCLISESDFLKFIPLFTNIKEDEVTELKHSYTHHFDFGFLFNN